jgi:hypothetical protein
VTRRGILAVFIASALLGAGAPVAAEQRGIAIELNKLEPKDRQCAAYFVVTNRGSTNYQEFKLDLVIFRPDGVIGGRFAIDLAPIKANKRTVKLFELTDTSCEDVGSVLINEAMSCKGEGEPAADCLQDIAVSSLTKVPLTK